MARAAAHGPGRDPHLPVAGAAGGAAVQPQGGHIQHGADPVGVADPGRHRHGAALVAGQGAPARSGAADKPG